MIIEKLILNTTCVSVKKESKNPKWCLCLELSKGKRISENV